MEENFATRLKLFMDSLHVQSSQFADMCEIPRPSFSQLLSGRNQKVNDIIIKKIHAAYPELSVMWLMFGEGPMLTIKDKKENNESTLDPLEADKSIKSPITDHEASEFQNLKALNQTHDTVKDNVYQQLEENKKILELQLQIDKLQKNPRRVEQITVYYDDSTFETFVPSKK